LLRLPGAVQAPLVKVIVDDLPRLPVKRQHPPGTAAAEQKKAGLQDFPLRLRLRTTSWFHIGDRMFNQRPFFAKGIYRDPVRSSHAHFVKVSGLCWLCSVLLTPMSWAHRVWALPLMTVLCPSEHFCAQQDRRAQTLVQRAWQIIHPGSRRRPL
jgi:hypothetical protein